MTIYYPLTEWPVLVCIGIFSSLIGALLYAQLATAGIAVTATIEAAPNLDNQIDDGQRE